jgi:hypothetical protein
MARVSWGTTALESSEGNQHRIWRLLDRDVDLVDLGLGQIVGVELGESGAGLLGGPRGPHGAALPELARHKGIQQMDIEGVVLRERWARGQKRGQCSSRSCCILIVVSSQLALEAVLSRARLVQLRSGSGRRAGA